MMERDISFTPIIFNRAEPAERDELDRLIREGRIWRRHDTLRDQLADLLRTRNPRREARESISSHLTEKIRELTQGRDWEDYGRWIYYPWSGQLVHLLPPEEFHELRTDRNRNKITAAEQQRLAACTVAIVGLSVGNAIALTLALEGVGGHLKLADFDTLDLSNMNRIRAGIDQLGLPKAVLTARQIYELNPYAALSLFHDGLTKENLDEFLQGEPAPDIVIDECDDIRMKVLLRERAREYRIPVLMETNDRGMLDVERFDLEPARPILHGLLGATTSRDLPDKMPIEEKIRYVLPVIGIEQISVRAAASMLEIEETLSTWPQPGADVILGGATICHAVRALALGERLPSGRRYIDLHDLIARDSNPGAHESVPENIRVAGRAEGATPSSGSLAVIPEHMQFLVAHAALAPSGGNMQPWSFYVDGDLLWLVHPTRRSRNLLDFDGTAAYLALGAALKNLSIAAAHRRYRLETELFPTAHRAADPEMEIIARIQVGLGDAVSSDSEAELFPFLETRVTNRKTGTRVPLELSVEKELREIAAGYDCVLHFVTAPRRLAELGRIVGECDRLRFLCEALHREMMAEIRWDEYESKATGDGIDLATLELTLTEEAVMKAVRRPEVAAFLRDQNGATRLRELSERAIQRASAMGLLSIRGRTPHDSLQGGQVMQHLWLTANARGWGWHPMTASLYLFSQQGASSMTFFDERERTSLQALSNRFNELFPESREHSRLMMFRLSQAGSSSARSLRLPLEQVLNQGRP